MPCDNCKLPSGRVSSRNTIRSIVWKKGSCAEKRLEESCIDCKQQFFAGIELARKTRVAYGVTGEKVHFIKLPLRFNATLLEEELIELEKQVSWTHREDVNNYFILLVTREGIVDDQSKYGPFKAVRTE